MLTEWKIIQKIKKDLLRFDKVILVRSGGKEVADLVKMLIEHVKNKPGRDRLLVMSNDVPEDGAEGGLIQKISKEDEQKILSIYRMYEFSDRFSVIGRDRHYGSLLNYVDQGKLTIEEALEALIGI